jgi:mono/diheme cytochrome c family protein
MKARAPALLAAFVISGLAAANAGESVEYLYQLHCSGCHGTDGVGSKVGRIPPFAGIVEYLATTPEGRLYLVRVPGVANAALSDAETANLLDYMLHRWGGHNVPIDTPDFTAEEVHRLRDVHVDDITAMRRKLAVELSRRGISIAY